MGCSGSWNFWDNGNVDLSKATWLVAEKVPLIVDKGGIPGVKPTIPVNNLFSLPPGTKVKAAALGGTIDPTGTTIVNDFDGDGILNADETTTNVWVADYPVIEAIVAPPVTMKIEILKNSQNTSDEITSEINSSDFESTKTQGSEKIHQNEVNLRTVQFQDSFASSNELSGTVNNSFNVGTQVGIGPVSTGFNYGMSNSISWESKNSTSMTTTKWADKPFKNNIDTQSNNLKSSSATSKAKKFRSEKAQKINETAQIDANAGYVRAALYIKNTSVNMPVKLKNILCSLMFENGTGDLIPIQSFRLRNDDFSLFEVSVYGGSEFGPYVVQLSGLNTSEIENAIAAGYNPKIYIVDYEMTHVEDSNYKSSLLNFSGNNLKIIEENAKGRTGLVRVYGPNIRQMYRVAAFDAPENSDPCARTATSLSPGITLRKALERLQCNGFKVEFEDYVIDFSEVAPSLGEYKIHLKGIKNLGPVPTNIPCTYQTKTGSDGVSRTACVQKPTNEWSEEEKKNAGVWAIYSNGKYYNLTEYYKDLDDSVRTFDPTNSQKVPMVKGVDSIIWAGDYYDIVYISFKDMLKKEEEKTFGTNPLETQRDYMINSSWDLSKLGKYPYDPEVNSLFLGKLGFGERLELNIKLNNNQYITPDFGLPVNGGLFQYYSNFSYNITNDLKKLSIDQVADFEINLGFGGERSDWFHIVKDLDNSNAYKPKNCGRTLDYVNQTYTLCIELPTEHNYVDPEVSLINIYLRPSLSNAYRRTIWPLPYTDVRKMRGELANPVAIGDNTISVANSSGIAAIGESIYILGDSNSYTISNIGTPASDGSYVVTIGSTIKKVSKKTTEVYVKGSLTAPDVRLTVENGFATDWNTQVQSAFNSTGWNISQYLPFELGTSVSCSANPFHPLSCLGVTPNLEAVNWSGAYNKGVALWNSWADATKFPTFLSGGLFGLSTNTGKVYRLDSSKSDVVLSDAVQNAGGLGNSLKVVISGNTGFKVHYDSVAMKLKGLYFNVLTGQALTNEFVILTNVARSSIDNFDLSIQGTNAVLVWEEYDNSANTFSDYIKIFDITSLNTTFSGTVISSSGSYQKLTLATDSTRAFVSWLDSQVKARVYNLSTGLPVAAAATAITINYNADNGSIYYLLSKVNGGKAIVAIRYYDGTSQTYIKYGIIDLSTGNKIGSDRSITITGNADLSIAMSAARAIVTGITSSTSGGSLQSQIVDLSNSNIINTLSLDTGVSQSTTDVSSNTGIVTYSKGNRIYLRTVDLTTGLFASVAPLAIDSATSATSKRIASSIINGNTLILLWEHTEGGKTTLRGRSVSIAPLAIKGPGDFFVSTTNEGNQVFPTIANSGDNGFVAWSSQDALKRTIRGTYLNLANPGTLQYGMNNFFIAPMIERDFTIWTKVTQ
ncbi:hypothetical protein EHQ64_02865 [Leptospira sarikeiensis]|uniref:Lipoprotein n=1 Tax=Leptospira sarikeiensis TaxID=2484943 RepID=A0A4R9KC30_9LEPT|nr:hypothetical protein EHQ64_02865 [Leptospira sarikeiensis]